MTKQGQPPKNRDRRGRDRVRQLRDWKPLLPAIRDVIDWSLDIATVLARDYDEDVESIRNVRACFHAWLEGRACEMDLHDLLLTFGTILAAIELDLGIESAQVLAPLRGLKTSPAALAPILHFPGVTRVATRRRCPGACALAA